MRTLLTLTFLHFAICSFSQELKEKKQSNDFCKEIFFVSQKEKQRCGNYVKLSMPNKDTLIKGTYENGIKTGLWTYYNGNSKYEYNYSTNQLISVPETTSSNNSFMVAENDKYVIKKVDNAPFFLGSIEEIKFFIKRIRLPESIFRKGLTGVSIISLDISSKGDINYSILNSLDVTFEKYVVDILNKYKEKWVPAKVDGKEVDSRILIKFTITSNRNIIEEVDQPYVWNVNYIVFGSTF